MLVKVGEDGLPIYSGRCLGEVERARMDRKAELLFAYQLGQEAAGGDVRSYKLVLMEKFPGDGEAQIEFERGVSHASGEKH